jgi:hypothetical protein
LTETTCRFCGVSAHLPHETQEACIAALHEELARLREILHSRKLGLANPVSGADPSGADPISGSDPKPEAGADSWE